MPVRVTTASDAPMPSLSSSALEEPLPKYDRGLRQLFGQAGRACGVVFDDLHADACTQQALSQIIGQTAAANQHGLPDLLGGNTEVFDQLRKVYGFAVT